MWQGGELKALSRMVFELDNGCCDSRTVFKCRCPIGVKVQILQSVCTMPPAKVEIEMDPFIQGFIPATVRVSGLEMQVLEFLAARHMLRFSGNLASRIGTDALRQNTSF